MNDPLLDPDPNPPKPPISNGGQPPIVPSGTTGEPPDPEQSSMEEYLAGILVAGGGSASLLFPILGLSSVAGPAALVAGSGMYASQLYRKIKEDERTTAALRGMQKAGALPADVLALLAAALGKANDQIAHTGGAISSAAGSLGGGGGGVATAISSFTETLQYALLLGLGVYVVVKLLPSSNEGGS